MNKELKDKVELSISNGKHVLEMKSTSTLMNIESVCSPEVLYLLEKIEELQSELSSMRVKYEIDRTTKHRKIK